MCILDDAEEVGEVGFLRIDDGEWCRGLLVFPHWILCKGGFCFQERCIGGVGNSLAICSDHLF